MTDKINLNSAVEAYNSFFAKGEPEETSKENNPVNKVVEDIKKSKTPPNKRKGVVKVDSETGVASEESSMSMDQAKRILDDQMSYEDILKEHKILKSELFSIIDMYLEKGFYTRKYTIKGFEFGLVSRKVYSMDNISHVMEESNYVTQGGIMQLTIKHRLASSLCYYKLRNGVARIFDHSSVEDDTKVMEFLTKEVSSPNFALMAREMQRFDLLVAISTREEAINDFLALTTD